MAFYYDSSYRLNSEYDCGGIFVDGITVTMPIKEYERMKEQIETLKAKNVENFINRSYNDMLTNDYDIEVDVKGIISALDKELAKAISEKTISRIKRSEFVYVGD